MHTIYIYIVRIGTSNLSQFIGVKSCHHHELQYKVSRSTRFHKSNVLCVLRLTCDSRIKLRNISSKKTHVWFSPKKTISKKAPQKKKNTSNTHKTTFPETEQLAFSNFSAVGTSGTSAFCCPLYSTVPCVFRVFRVPRSHRHELQLEAHDHQIKPRGWFQPSARHPQKGHHRRIAW